MSRIFPFLLLISLILALSGCGGGTGGNGLTCGGSQADYDDAYAACYDVGQADVCAGEDRGANYEQSSYDLCSDGIGDESLDGCEFGYGTGYDDGCAS